MKTFSISLFLVLPLILFGEIISREEVYLSKDRSKVSLINITKAHSGNQTIITADTVKNLYPSENAKAYITQEIAEVLMNESYLFWLPDSLTKQNTYLLKKNIYERYSLEVVGDKIFYCYKGYYYKPANLRSFYISLLNSILLLIIVLLFLLRGTIGARVMRIIFAGFLLFSSALFVLDSFIPIIDNLILTFTMLFPAFLLTFFFKKKMKDEK